MKRIRITNILYLLGFTTLAISATWNPGGGSAQKAKSHPRVFSGPYDGDLPYPSQEGVIGQKDPAAMAEIRLAMTADTVTAQAELEIAGTITEISGNNQQAYPASLAVGTDGRFRLDLKKNEGIRTLRINGDMGKVKQGNQVASDLEDSEFYNPLAIPFLLSEVASRKDASVVEDGPVTLDGRHMNKVTITLFQVRYGGPISASVYFDSDTHLLWKSVLVEHSLGNRSLKYLTVTTYEDYRRDQSILLPHDFSETVNGSATMRFKVTSMSITPNHDASYFSF